MWRPNFSSATEGLLEVLISPEQQQAWCRTCVTVNEISSTVTFFECRTKVTALRRISLERLSWSWNIRGYHRLLPFIFTLRCLKKSLFSDWSFFPFSVEGGLEDAIAYSRPQLLPLPPWSSICPPIGRSARSASWGVTSTIPQNSTWLFPSAFGHAMS